MVTESVLGENQADPPPAGMTYLEAEQLCEKAGGVAAGDLDSHTLETTKLYLNIWRHSMQEGDIWVGKKADQCKLIQVLFIHPLKTDSLLENYFPQTSDLPGVKSKFSLSIHSRFKSLFPLTFFFTLSCDFKINFI